MKTRTRTKQPLQRRATMKAIVQDTYGPADVLRPDEIDVPQIGADEVLVRVHAASINHGDWLVTTGVPYLMRAVFGLRRPGRGGRRGRDPVPPWR